MQKEKKLKEKTSSMINLYSCAVQACTVDTCFYIILKLIPGQTFFSRIFSCLICF